MEEPIVASSDLSNLENICPPEVPVEAEPSIVIAVKADIPSEAPAEKELSWEKIAAEISDFEVAKSATEVINNGEGEAMPVDEVVEAGIEEGNAQEPPKEDAVEEVIEASEAPPPPPPEEELPPPPPPPPEDDVNEVVETVVFEERSEVVEISEVIQDVDAKASDDSSEVEYTVIEAETHEIIEEHLAATHAEESVVAIEIDDEEPDDEDVEAYTIIHEDADDPDEEDSEPVDEPKEKKVKRPRGRRPISSIPLHVLGRDITKPSDAVPNGGGRPMPKPRLGVKVPYKNLTSQIVSKAEIEQEIMDRFKRSQETTPKQATDFLFASKLTQRLAKKIIPKKDKNKNEAGSSKTKTEIQNDSDLLAILEGEEDHDEDISPKPAALEDNIKREMDPEEEREIALQQLKELPVLAPDEEAPPPKNRFFKTRGQDVKVVKPKGEPPKPKPVEVEAKSEVKTNKGKKAPPEIEPRLKPGAAVKTYTRKRKSQEIEEPPQPPKKNTLPPLTPKPDDGTYVTKSSRIIKRKVIWDPAEADVKNPLKSPKAELKKFLAENEKKTPKTPISKKELPTAKEATPKTPLKKDAIVSTPKGTPTTTKKRLTEVDRLLMDEGAVNMLYDVKNNEDQDKSKKKQKSVISLDRAHKELMSKTNVIKNDLQQQVGGAKTLRKKESPKKEATPSAVQRKKSKDSVRSSLHSPPASPAYNVAEASRIIRRHSSSSFSSGDEDDDRKSESPKKKAKKNADKPTKEGVKSKSVGQYKSFSAVKTDGHVAVVLAAVDSQCFLTEALLRELTTCLKEVAKDEGCWVVSVTSEGGKAFCQGLDYRVLVVEDEAARKKKALEVANLVKEFLKCLMNFPKILVAGIQGECVGLGVTMLPLFDIVLASDTSTFSTPYGKLGCVAEAGFLLTLPNLTHHGLASELLYTSQILKADDASRKGLVTRLCWPEKYKQELKTVLTQITNQSQQSLEATKHQLRHQIFQDAESRLNPAGKVLVEHWISEECQNNFKQLDVDVD